MIAPGGDLLDFFEFFLPTIPSILAWLAILTVALVNWRRYPGPSLLVLLAAILNLVSLGLLTMVNFWLIQEGGFWLEQVLNWVRSFMDVASAALMVLAVYTWRNSPMDLRTRT